ncbi:MAG: translocation/assembly module TamB, partial [Leeuwenhoekiella sp.]
MGLLAVLVIFFSIPAVQTYIAKKATDSLNETYGTSINVDQVHIKYNGQVDIKKIYIADHHQDTLIYSDLAETSLLSISSLVLDNTMNVGAVSLEGTNFFIKKYQGEENDNLNIFSNKFNTGSETATPFHMTAGKVNISQGHFRFTNEDLEPGSEVVVDYRNLAINADDFTLDDQTITAQVNNLYFDAAGGYHIRGLQGSLKYSPEAIIIDELDLKTEHSTIEGSVTIDISDDAFSDFVNRAKFDFRFTNASLSTTDLKAFYPDFGSNKEINFTGDMKGPLNDLYLSNIDMRGLGNSKINGNLYLQQLFNTATDFKIDANLNQLQSNYYDLAGLLPQSLGKSLPKEMMRLGVVNLKGRTIITGNSVYAKTIGSTGLGKIETDLELTNTQNIAEASYVGDIKATDFHLGRLLNVQQLGRISFGFNVGGSGFSQELLNTRVRGKISSVAYNNYRYSDISVSGNLQNPIFNGQLQINDKNAKLSFDGLVDVTKAVNNYDFTADIDYIDLAKLNFLNDSIAILKGRVVMDMTGTTIDNVVGSIQFSKASFENANDLYDFNDFVISSTFSDNIRTISMDSPDIISGEVSGNFRVDDVVPLFRNAVGSLYTNYEPSIVTQDQFMNFNFQINSKIVEVFVPQIELEPETFIRGSVVSNDSDFKLTFRSPQIKAFGFLAQGINMRVDNKNPLFNTFIEADSIGSGIYGVSDFNLINATLKDTLFMRSEFKGGPQNEDNFNLNFYHTINSDNNSVVGFSKSGIKFKNNDWFINEQNNDRNRIIFTDNLNDINIEELVMSHDREHISLKGTIQDSTAMDLKTDFQNVRLSHITPYIDSLDIKGVVNGNLNLLKKNGAFLPESNMTIDTLTVNSIALGNLNLNIEGNTGLTNYDINARLINNGFESLNASGMISVDQQRPYIDMDVRLSKLNLAAFSPLGGIVLSDIRGLASGQARVIGNYKNPEVNGEILLR